MLGQAHQLERTTDLHIDTSRVSGGQVAGRDTDLGRLVENLATNAARYAGTTVAFSVQQHDGMVEFTVSDDGPGIAAADRARIFERFSTLEDARSPGRTGGRPRPVDRSVIVAAHHGSIRIEDAPGGSAVRGPVPDGRTGGCGPAAGLKVPSARAPRLAADRGLMQ